MTEKEQRCITRRLARYQKADTHDKLIMNLRDMSHILRSQAEGRASQKRILMILNESEPITQKELTERLRIQPGSASEILSRLEEMGLLRRTPSDRDRRTTDIRLTQAGRGLAQEAARQREKRHSEMFSCLTEEEKKNLLQLLEKVREDWQVRYEDNGGTAADGAVSAVTETQ